MLIASLGVTLAWPAFGAPLRSPRVRLVLEGRLPARVISDGRAGPGPGRDRALVTVRVPGGARTLSQLGFTAQPLGAEWAAVRATREELLRLAARPEVLALEERRLLHPLLDQSGPAVGAPAARVETGLDGAGVLVGVIDTGIDFRHADFRATDGKTRVAALLDLSLAPNLLHPELGTQPGAVFLRDELDAQLAADETAPDQPPSVPSIDEDGHGSHVAGIAAGNGRGTGQGLPAGRYVGMAPGAELVVARASGAGGTFSDVDVLACVQFATQVADALGRPLVVNLSLGGSGGPHDGTSNFELALDALFPPGTPGRALVAAVGNDGQLDEHAFASRIGDGAGSGVDGELVLPLEAGKGGVADSLIAVEIYHRGALRIEVETPGGKRTHEAASGESLSADAAEAKIGIASGNQPLADGRFVSGVTLAGLPGQAPGAGTWKLHLRGQASRVDAWVVESPDGAPYAHFTQHLAEDTRLSLPASARQAISVGSFVTRNSWTAVSGELSQTNARVGAISSFSSTGPTADGRFAPDVTAPGELVASTLSRDAPPTSPSSSFYYPQMAGFTLADDGVHGVLRGTSQAAPHVTGALALLLEADPTLTPEQLREALRTSAQPPDGAAFGPRQGFGRLDVLAALRLVRGARGGAVSPDRSTLGVSRDALAPGDDTTLVTVTPRDADGVPLGPGHAVTLDTTAGEWAGELRDAGFGRYERTLTAHAQRGQVATLTATVDGVALAAPGHVYFVNDRSEIGRPFVAGGCQVPPGSRPASPALWLGALALVLASRRARRGFSR